ncbi:hypothetical protein [Bradyrhizobium sp. BWA-3-5]|uniref:hypothetical protein n=1 Tax=Bradyrhizobium sp. BWA-3-5 TaxID=3080013 RepID=UPI00293EBDA5|nr:hypothetical protein [Bradyrhizobium sp. BWA-3-5]WOH68185.1 hypothetical protein RX331_10890 [Bradyrhizobium sp. BWA-3-5]
MRVLILHEIDDIASARRTSVNHAFCLIKYAPQNEYTLHSVRQPVTSRLRNQCFDAIILDTTFLTWRWAKPKSLRLDRILDEYAFIAKSDAVKIALPQDEYDHTELLDNWLADWKVDLIYSVCHEHSDEFYPRAGKHAAIVEGLTGYIDDADVAMMQRFSVPFRERKIDVGYRAKTLPAYFGRFGRMKSELGDHFRSMMSGRDLKLDISTHPGDVLVGDAWLQFLGNCKFTLGCESGSSLIDPKGKLRECVESRLRRNPSASFEELERACFSGQDMKRAYSAIGPRLLEAAIAGSCQILIPGRYAGALNPGEHYIPVEPDCSNADEVFRQMQDDGANEARINACYRALIGNPKFHYRHFVSDLLAQIRSIGDRKGLAIVGAGLGEAAKEADLREAFTRSVLRVYQNHVDDMKEIGFVPNFLHTLAVVLGRLVLTLGHRIRG